MKELTKKELTLRKVSIIELDNKNLFKIIGGSNLTGTFSDDDRSLSSHACGSSVSN